MPKVVLEQRVRPSVNRLLLIRLYPSQEHNNNSKLRMNRMRHIRVSKDSLVLSIPVQ